MLRFARWCAVSSKEQDKPGKFSISDQLERTKETALSKGWVETAGPFVARQSREMYIQLYQAEAEIEAMRLMLASARDGQFDILVMTETDRMRGLLEQVFRTLAQYRIQLYFTNIPVEPIAPADYSIHNADQVLMIIKMAQTASSLEISRTRRKWFTGMPNRITQLGLPAAHIPFGYRKPPGHETDRKAIPEPDPSLCAHLVRLKDLLLEGKSTSQLIDYLEDRRIAAPKGGMWHKQTVRDILRNPFYAGIVQFGKSRVYLDPVTDTRKRNRRIPSDQIKTNRGKHVPLWDEATLAAITHEFKRRTKSYRGRVNNQFTGLVKCGVCGSPMWRQANGPRGEHRLIWRCSQRSAVSAQRLAKSQKLIANRCTNSMPHITMLEKVGAALGPALKPYTARQRGAAATHDEVDLHRRELHDLRTRQARLEEAYLSGKWDLDRYAARKTELDEQIAAAQNAIHFAERQDVERRLWVQSLSEMQKHDNLPHWLESNNPAEINRALGVLLDSIVVKGDRVELKFR